MTDRIVNEINVARREEGILVTYSFEDGGMEERYYSAMEARDILNQLKRQLSSTPESPVNGN